MVRVVRRAVAEDLGVDLRAALLRGLELLEHEHARALAHHEAGARRVERPRRARRVLVLGDEPAHRAEAGEDQRVHARLGAAGEHRVRAAALDQLRRLADGVRAGGARRHRRVVRAAEAERDRELAARRVGEHARDEGRRDAREPALAQHVGLLDDADEAADRRAEEDPDARGVVGAVEAGIGDRLPAGAEREEDVALELPGLLRRRNACSRRSP